MNLNHLNIKVNHLAFLLLAQLMLCITIAFEIPVARQILGFLFLTFVPGFVLVKFMGFWGLNKVETVLISTVLSIALLMLIGLLVNFLGPILGVPNSLSTIPMLVGLNFLLIPLCFMLDKKYSKNGNGFSLFRFTNRLFASSIRYVFPFIVIFASIFGAFFVGNNFGHLIFLIVIILISGLLAVCIISEKIIPQKLYPLMLFAISLALIFQFFLLTPFLLGGGGDIFSEYYASRLLHINGYWNPTLKLANFEASKAKCMLSVTVLPEIYAQILNLDQTWIFKLVIPFLASIAFSLGLYVLYQTQTDKKTAFLATFLFLANAVGLGWGPAKQLVAEFFYIMLLFVFLNKQMSQMHKRILFLIFAFSLVVSHYSLSYIFLTMIFLVWGSQLLTKKKVEISTSQIIVFSIITFAWYIYTSGSSPFVALLNAGDHVYRNIATDFFNPLSRSEAVLRGIGATPAASLLHLVGRVLFYVTEFFILIGVLKIILKKEKFSREYTLLVLFNFVLLLLNIVIPSLAGQFLMERWYIVSLIILAPICIIGGKTVFESLLKYVFKWRNNNIAVLLLSLVVLIPFFLFNSGLVYEIARDESWSLPLSIHRMDNLRLHELIVETQEFSGAKWLSSYTNSSRSYVYSDTTSMVHILEPYGLIDTQYLKLLANTTGSLQVGDFIYLRWTNINEHTAMALTYAWNISDISSFLNNQNNIYSNGDCNILHNDA
jgi:uncharacterized membrane protein